MADEKQAMYPGENPPAYPGPATAAPPAHGYAPPGVPPLAGQGYAAPLGAPTPAGQGYMPQPGAPTPAGQGYAAPHGAPPNAGYPPMGYQPYPQAGPQYVPPGGYVAGQPVSVQPVVGQSVVFVHQHQFRQTPVNTVCSHCSQNIITSTTAEPGGLTWLLCAGICLFGFWLGCCLIPFCVDDCQDIRHSCPNCKNTIHVFRRM